ncbi:MAG TPA: hypothetical protein ENG50_01230 [Candidatus Altiarchaeales archaeon]|nr:hypothetical protein [Candidatus Altiarchaeales archaeon]
MTKKAQASLEYMSMVALSLLVIASVLYVITTFITTSKTQVNILGADAAVNDMKKAANFIYISGHPSRIEKSIVIPRGVHSIIIQDHLILIRMEVASPATGAASYTDVYAITKGNLTVYGDICRNNICNPGTYKFVFKSVDPNLGSGYDVNITRI